MSTTIEPRATAAPETGPPDETARRRAPRVSSGTKLAAPLLILWLLSGVYFVGPDQQAVVTRFGRVVENRVLPGMHFCWPFPAGEVHKLKVLQRQRAVIGGAPADQPLGQVAPLASQFFSGDQNLINVRTVVQYSVATPRDYLFQAADVPRIVGAVVESELARQIASRNVDDVLTTEKAAIQEIVRERAQALADRYRLGVVLSTVNIEYISPPAETAAAFRDVAGARADSVRIMNEAEGYANDLIPRARGEARQLTERAEAYRLRKINKSLGDAARFKQLAEQYRVNPAVTTRRLYLETMEEILPRMKKIIAGGDLDLTIIRRERGPAGEGPAPGGEPAANPASP